MKRVATVIGLIVAAAVFQPTHHADAQPRPSWDSRGWVLLGETTVNGHGRIDSDQIRVGAYEGRFKKINIVVEDGEFELVDFGIRFADGYEFKPRIGFIFREGQRTRTVDLPPGERVISTINFQYRNLTRGARPRVGVWGFKIGDNYAPPPPPPQPVRVDWDSRGWQMLGERTVNGRGRLDRDHIEVGRTEGRFNKLTLVVQDSDLEMVDFTVTFGRGQTWRPNVSHYFREGQRTRVIEFPESAWGNDNRTIRSIDFTYRNIPGEGHARVQVWAKRGVDAPPPPPPAPVFDSRGWNLLGETVVNGHGREDRDRVTVGRGEGKFSQLTIVVTDSDLELIDLSVQLRRGDPYHPAMNHYFREGQRARVVQLPQSESGNTARTIEWIDFTYRNLPGGGHARVQVWAR